MSNIKKISIVALVLLLVGITGSLLTVQAKTQSETIKEERIFNNEHFSNIEIEGDNASVEIIPANNSTTRVELVGNAKKDREYTLDADIQKNTLAVTLNEKQLKFYNFGFPDAALAIKVYVPKKKYDTLRAELANGSVTAEEMEIKTATVKTINGEIDLKGLETSTVTAQSDNGKILLEDIEGDISGKIINGSISFVTDHLDRNVDFESLNGKIEIQTAKEPANATIDAEVSHGNVTIFGDSIRDTVFGNGENLIKLTTLNGDVTVTK
ncbi:hypothetical protein WQ57_05580 [Mesobacillus campisalis]|uniref:DUF4097 domain-containing protein n=1 Tax=Mesobacillus campisalis TaxID=1408103 RepID=A0A0M2T1W3_9BACI|nr:DUF4097 family beta strand repeat-containing protein [Mesobacillus campisalis]KKK39232.1 hypothetical protein WQ57_05580 [Mesobacillus campisalis]